LARDESNKTKSTAMSVLPIQFSPELATKLMEFRNDRYCNWISMKIDTENSNETACLVDCLRLTDLNNLNQHLSKDEARCVYALPRYLNTLPSLSNQRSRQIRGVEGSFDDVLRADHCLRIFLSGECPYPREDDHVLLQGTVGNRACGFLF
jgi:hypothetical protein